MTRRLTPTEVAILRPLWQRRAQYLALAHEDEVGIQSLAHAFHGSQEHVELRADDEGGFVLITPETPEERAQRAAELVEGA